MEATSAAEEAIATPATVFERGKPHGQRALRLGR